MDPSQSRTSSGPRTRRSDVQNRRFRMDLLIVAVAGLLIGGWAVPLGFWLGLSPLITFLTAAGGGLAGCWAFILVGPIFPGVTASVVGGLALGLDRRELGKWMTIGIIVMYGLYTLGAATLVYLL